MKNKNVYINSLEASDIYEHMNREGYIENNYTGMIPHSLELIKLHSEGLSTFTRKVNKDKLLSHDIINLKFGQNVKSASSLVNTYKNKIVETVKQIDAIKAEYRAAYGAKDDTFQRKVRRSNLEEYRKLLSYVKKMRSKIVELEARVTASEWPEVKASDLRQQFYTEGFEVASTRNDVTTITKYVVYKRSSAKSRKGECLFIKEELADRMLSWSRMHLPFVKDQEVDLASLLAYESLVGSAIESTVKINPDNILIVSDVHSNFVQEANIVRKNEETGFLDSYTEQVEISNSLFDGQSLLDSRYFEDGKSMKLLRNHFFKSAAFNTRVQAYLKDHLPDGLEYSEWQLTDIFGNKINACDVLMITTPSSLKALKFSYVLGESKDMWSYWKQLVQSEGNVFGVCKSEKPSQKGRDDNGHILHQTSYQMLNSMPLSSDDLSELLEYEMSYIDRMKNDDQFFIEQIKKTANDMNSNEMFVSLYNKNPKIAQSKMFRDFRKQEIKDRINHVKKGKLRLKGDYCVMVGNPVEMLYHAIGQIDVEDVKSLSLKENEIYTTLFDFDKELSGFRNPHTSPSNVLLANNVFNEEIEKYLVLTPNIACVNAVGFALQDKLSGSDYDSDTVMLFDDPLLLERARECQTYKVCINGLKAAPESYQLNSQSMCKIDTTLSKSQRNIGTVVNKGQLCMSRYWDLLGSDAESAKKLLVHIDVLTVLSGVAIDMAKNKVELNIDHEIKNVVDSLELKDGKKPLFWAKISATKETVKYNCPMDELNQIMSSLPKAKYKKDAKLESFLYLSDPITNPDRKQKEKIRLIIDEMNNEIVGLKHSKWEKDEEAFTKIEKVMMEASTKISKLKVKGSTMYDILSRLETDFSSFKLKMANVLFRTQRNAFMSAFVSEKATILR